MTVMTRNVMDYQNIIALVGEHLAAYSLELDQKLEEWKRAEAEKAAAEAAAAEAAEAAAENADAQTMTAQHVAIVVCAVILLVRRRIESFGDWPQEESSGESQPEQQHPAEKQDASAVLKTKKKPASDSRYRPRH